MIIQYPNKAIVLFDTFSEQHYFKEYINGIVIIYNYIVDYNTPFLDLITFVGL